MNEVWKFEGLDPSIDGYLFRRYIRNPRTKRLVLVGSKGYNRLVAMKIVEPVKSPNRNSYIAKRRSEARKYVYNENELDVVAKNKGGQGKRKGLPAKRDMSNFIINPLTNRKIKVGGRVHKQLIKNGVLN